MTPTFVIVLGVFGTVFCGGCVIVLIMDRYHVQVEDRLRSFSKTKQRFVGVEQNVKSTERRQEQVPRALARLVSNSDEDRHRHQSRLIQAGIYNPTALSTFFAVKLALIVFPPLFAIIGGWWGIVDTRMGLVWGCVAGGIGMILPSLWLESRIRHRHCILQRSLPDFLDLMIVCLESGLSLQGTIQRVSDELRLAHPELAGELNIVQRDVELGTTIDAALRRFADRSGFDGIRSLSSFVREAQRFGTQLTDALRLHADMLRSQRENIAEERAQKAAVKILIPTLLLILPAVFVVLAGPALIQIQQAFSK